MIMMYDKRTEEKIKISLKYWFKSQTEKEFGEFFLVRTIWMDVLPPLNSKMIIDVGYEYGVTKAIVEDIVTKLGKDPFNQEFTIYLINERVEPKPMDLENLEYSYGVSTIEEYKEKLKTLGWDDVYYDIVAFEKEN